MCEVEIVKNGETAIEKVDNLSIAIERAEEVFKGLHSGESVSVYFIDSWKKERRLVDYRGGLL